MVNRRPAQTRARIAQTASRLRSLIHPEAVAPDELLVSERTGRIPYAEAQALEYRPAEIGETFGPQWATYWFRLAATVPEHWAGRPVELVWDSGCEALLYRDGAPVQGLVRGGGYDRITAPLGTPAGRVELELEMACNDLMGLPDPFPRRRDRTGRTWQEPHGRPLAAGAAAARPTDPRRPRAVRPRGVGDWRGTSRRCASSSRSRASTRPGRAGCSPSSTASPAPGSPPTAAPGPRRARSSATCSRTATPAARTRSPRSATRTSTPPGCGRWPRRAARSCARGRASSR